MNILDVTEKAVIDNTITNFEIHTHQPYASTSFNNNDEIRIPIQQQDMYTLPCQSYIYLEGKLLKKDGKPATSTKFINNGIAFLFSEIRYELNGVVIDSVRNPGITATMKSYLSFTPNDSTRLENAGWYPKTGSVNVDKNGNFNVCIPLKMLLGFAEDYRKIILNVKQELVLIRNNSDIDALIDSSGTSTEIAKVQIDKLYWKVPHVNVSIAQQLILTKYMDKNIEIQIPFRSWEIHEYPVLPTTTRHSWAVKTATQLETPRFIILGLQTDRKNNSSKDMSRFDRCDISNVRVYLNSERYPYDNLNINFSSNHFATLYEMYSNFQQSYYDKDSEPLLSPLEYLTDAPLIVIDCSRQKDTLQTSAVEIRIEFETNSNNIPDKTSAYCLILHDRIFSYSPLTKVVRQV